MSTSRYYKVASSMLCAASILLTHCTDRYHDSFINTPAESKPSCVRYVDINSAAEEPDGLSWGTAFPSLQEGIDSASKAIDDVEGSKDDQLLSCEVWVVSGEYPVLISGNEDTVLLAQKVELFGGFNGSEEYRSERDWKKNETILQGETTDGKVCHVVSFLPGEAADSAAFTRIDGFTITGGDASCEGEDGERGGGMLVDELAVIENCRFTGNNAWDGGGLFYKGERQIALINSEFTGNEAAGRGGGIAFGGYGTLIVQGCFFIGNKATGDAGGLFFPGGRLVVQNSVFSDNISRDGRGGGLATLRETRCPMDHLIERSFFLRNRGNNGGGMYIGGCRLNLNNSIFYENQADRGGGLEASKVRGRITNCVLSSNRAVLGGAASFFYPEISYHVAIWNSIIWNNSTENGGTEIDNGSEGALLSLYYSVLKGGCFETLDGCGSLSADRVIDEDPLFRGAEDGDFRLSPGSPCIDAAAGVFAPQTDLDGKPRVDDPEHENTGLGPPWADIGAYEFVR